MRILSIGNSFSQDAHKWLAPAAASMGIEIECFNLYIGGCSLKRHWDNVLSGEAVYELERNGAFERYVSLEEALCDGVWDVVTLQQASPYSGLLAHYEPYLGNLFRLVREKCPDARVFLHRTWAYDEGCSWESFANYHYSTEEMEQKVAAGYRYAASLIGVPMIPTGEVIAALRQDKGLGSESLTRDGAHLSHVYGRYAAALTWIATLTAADIRLCSFIPEFEGYSGEEKYLSVIRDTVYRTLKK